MSLSRNRRQQRVLTILKEDPVVTVACKKANVGRETFYRWKREDAEFAKQADEAIQLGDDRYNDLAESKLMSLIQNGEIRAIMFRLNNKHPSYSYPKVLPAHEPIRFKPIEVMNIGNRKYSDKS